MMANIYIKIYMTSHGLTLSRFIWQVMANISQHLYDKWWLIYFKVYMTSDGLYIWRFIWQVMAYIYIYQDLYDKW